jgi:hypothetical protein
MGQRYQAAAPPMPAAPRRATSSRAGRAILSVMASMGPAMLRTAGPLARAAVGAARGSTIRAAAAAALRRLEAPPPGTASSHPLTPAAVRVERARSHGHGDRAEQTAVTVWFGQGPSLPVPGGGEQVRNAMRLTTGVVGAVALAALSVIAARREEQRARVIDAPVAAARVR